MAQTHLSYTSRDFESIKADLVNAIPNLTDIWTSREESDPGMVLITLMAALGDNLSFNMDQQSLEFYGRTFTQRKSAARVLDLIGYKLHWYKSATLEVTVYNTNPTHSVFLQFNPAGTNTQKLYSSTITNAPSYFLLNPDETPSNWDSTTTLEIPAGGSKTLQAVQGTLTSITFDSSAIDINNRYYIPQAKIDQNHLWLKDISATPQSKHNLAWYLTDNINNLTDTLPRFEFGVDEYNLPYIEFVPYWRSVYGETHTFKLFYLVTRGSTGNVATNVLNKIARISDLNKQIKPTDILITHGANTVPNIKLTNTPGKDPQTAKEAYYDSRNYIGVYNTLVTLLDFEKYMSRLELISAVRAVDGQYAKEYNELLPDEEHYNKLLPLDYIEDSFTLTDGEHTYKVLPDDSVTAQKYGAEQLMTFYDYNPEIPGTWFKADKHVKLKNVKEICIDKLGAESIGSLKFVHNGSAGDLCAGFNMPIEDQTIYKPTGSKILSFQIHFENIPNLTDNDAISKITNLKLLYEEDGFESQSIDILTALSNNGIKAIFEKYEELKSGYPNEFPSFDLTINTYGTGIGLFRLIYTIDQTKTPPTNPLVLYLDNIQLKDIDGADIGIDRLKECGQFSIKQRTKFYSTDIEASKFVFIISNPTDAIDKYLIHEYSYNNGIDWTLVDNYIVTLPVDTLNNRRENRTYFLKRATDEFAPYSLQLHMVAGDFLVESATNSSYSYAVEQPITVEHDVTTSEPQGYILYQLGDTVVGPSSDSLVSQTNFNDVRLFNSEVSYGPVRKFPFFVDGKIHLKYPARPAEANLILSRVYAALQSYFNAYNLELGEKITFNNIIAVIRSADPAIDYFDAGANNEHGSLFIYPTTNDYNPHEYNPDTRKYGKYGVNINPKYFNDISMQHYEDMLQANNSIVYWGDTMSGHLSIAEDSIYEKATPLTSGISAVLSYDSERSGIVTPNPDVVNLYEYNIVRTAVLDVEHKLVPAGVSTTDSEGNKNSILIRKYTNFTPPEATSYAYSVRVPIKKRSGFEQSIAFRFTLRDSTNSSRLFGWSRERKAYAILDELGQPIVNGGSNDVGDIFESSYFKVDWTDKQDTTEVTITVTDPIVNVSASTLVYFLEKAEPVSYVSYYNTEWSSSNKFLDIYNSVQQTTDSQSYSVVYETLTDTDHIWGAEPDYLSLTDVGVPNTISFTVYDLFDNGFMAAIRSKETITSLPSAVVVSNYAKYPDIF